MMVIFHIRNLTPVCSDPRLLISKNLDPPCIWIPRVIDSREIIQIGESRKWTPANFFKH